MVLSGKDISDSIKAGLAREVASLKEKYGRAPGLAVILVGDDPASATYVRSKEKACLKTGIENRTIRLPEHTSSSELLEEIAKLNGDDSVDGILVQLPLPRHISEQEATSAIAREKDVDGFHPGNTAALWSRRPACGNPSFAVPCTPRGVIRLLDAAGVRIEGKRAVVLGRSNIVGLPVAKLLLDRNATVTVCHSRTEDIGAVTREADIIVAAVGKPEMIKGDMVKDGVAVIDVGINRMPDGSLKGDVDFDSVAPKASVITPVPGGVGPMTICSLLENTIDCFLQRVNNQ